jgi:hypothetical protein
MQADLQVTPKWPSAHDASNPTCYQLNGLNLALAAKAPAVRKFPIPDIQLQIQQPTGVCNACNVSYAVSAALKDDEYVAIGFKGKSWETGDQSDDRRPCYFGMCVDDFDAAQSKGIAVGYATSGYGACVREMEASPGSPNVADVAATARIISGTRVERRGGRTIMHFTVPQHWPEKEASDGYFRVMWAKGAVTGGEGCNATLGYHGITRGVAPLEWLTLNSRPCTFDEGMDIILP